MLHPGLAPPGADRFIERVVAADRAEGLAISRAETADRVVVEQHLADRTQLEAVERTRRTLTQRIEAAQAFERVAEKIEADRLGRPGRVEIDDAAAHCKLAGLAHRIGAEIPVVAEKALQPVERNMPARPEGQDAPVEQPARRDALHQRVDRRQHDQRPALLSAGEAGQRVDASAADLAVRRYPVIGQAIPRRKGQLSELGVKKLERSGEPRHPPVVAADMQPRLGCAFTDEAADRRGIVPFGRAEQGDGAGLLGERAGEGGKRGHCPYSMTSSARAKMDWGIVKPSALAVFRLMTNSNVVGCWTGKSAGLAPFRISPT